MQHTQKHTENTTRKTRTGRHERLPIGLERVDELRRRERVQRDVVVEAQHVGGARRRGGDAGEQAFLLLNFVGVVCV